MILSGCLVCSVSSWCTSYHTVDQQSKLTLPMILVGLKKYLMIQYIDHQSNVTPPMNHSMIPNNTGGRYKLLCIILWCSRTAPPIECDTPYDTGRYQKLLVLYDTVDHQLNVTPPMIPQRHLSHKLRRVCSALCHNAMPCNALWKPMQQNFMYFCAICTAAMQYNID